VKNNNLRVILWMGLLAACLPPTVVRAQGHQGHHQSGISGQVERVILFHDWNVSIVSDTGDFVADFPTQEDGNFAVNLKPGSYVLTAYIPDFGAQGTLYGPSVQVTVEKQQFTSVFLPIVLPPL